MYGWINCKNKFDKIDSWINLKSQDHCHELSLLSPLITGGSSDASCSSVCQWNNGWPIISEERGVVWFTFRLSPLHKLGSLLTWAANGCHFRFCTNQWAFYWLMKSAQGNLPVADLGSMNLSQWTQAQLTQISHSANSNLSEMG